VPSTPAARAARWRSCWQHEAGHASPKVLWQGGLCGCLALPRGACRPDHSSNSGALTGRMGKAIQQLLRHPPALNTQAAAPPVMCCWRLPVSVLWRPVAPGGAVVPGGGRPGAA
jgi:hypothetical protein